MGFACVFFNYVLLGSPHVLFPNRLICWVCARLAAARHSSYLCVRETVTPSFGFFKVFLYFFFSFSFSSVFFNPGEDS